MPMRRTIGISLACLVTSACATAETPKESTSHYTGEAADIPQGYLTDACSGISDPCCGAVRVVGSSQVGKAAWYNQVGKPTATDEILDTTTATAAHRSLPLASCARVTNVDNGRSVVVKINDRGPYTRGRILDLSPRAADALDMKRAGVVAVVIEPLVSQTTPTVTVF